jgi:hypothetical protein
MKLTKWVGLVMIVASPALCQAIGLEDAATGMAKDAATDAAKSAAKDTAKSMVPTDVAGASKSAQGAAKSAEQAKKMTSLPGTEKAGKDKKSTKEKNPIEQEAAPTGE